MSGIRPWLATHGQEVLFFCGLLLLGVGAAWIYAPAGFIVVGAGLVWIAIPTRQFPIVFPPKGKR